MNKDGEEPYRRALTSDIHRPESYAIYIGMRLFRSLKPLFFYKPVSTVKIHQLDNSVIVADASLFTFV